MTNRLNPITFSKDLTGGRSSESGQSELLFLGLMFILFLLILFYNKRMIHFNQQMIQRQNAYLCLKHGFEAHIDLEEEIKLVNNAIKATLAAIVASAGTLTPKLKPVLNGLKKLQYVLVFKDIIGIYQKDICSMEQKILLIRHIPLQFSFTTFTIKRRVGGLAMFKKKKENFIFPSSSFGNSDFLIKGEVHFTPSLSLHQSQEYSLEVINMAKQGELKSYVKTLMNRLNPKNLIKHAWEQLTDLSGVFSL